MVELEEKTKDIEELKIPEIKENESQEKQQIIIPKKKSKKWIIISILIMAVILLIFSTIFAIINIGNKGIIKGISIENIDVSNMTIEEATNLLEEIINKDKENEIIFKYKEVEIPITYEALEVEFNIKDVVEKAYKIGRDSNILKNNFEILSTWINTTNIKLTSNFDENVVKQVCENINNTSEDAIIEPSYYIEDDKLIITPGKKGINVNQNEVKNKVNDILNINSEKSTVIEVMVDYKEPQPIDLEKIHNEIFKEAKDAYYTNEPFTIYPEVKGIDFDMENAKMIISEEKEEYEIPIIITQPNKTVNDIGTEAFPDLLGTCSTKYNAGNTGRTTNLKLSAGKINGKVLLAGEEFSYNKTVGERTIAAGYKMAATYSGGKVVDGLGGGICQISSTLYDAVVFADLDVTVRRNHQFVTSYLPGGKDATVVWGAQDFKFKNSRKYPIKITATVSGGVATIQVWGHYEETEYDISIETKKTATIAYTTQYINDSSLPAGTQKVVQKGNNGSKYEAYKVKKLNGEVVSRTLLSKDTYNAMQKIIRVGTGN
ncbi:MAG: hypothetical protein BHV99_02775 [Clostridium sp. 26_21]|nr:MAG: hypothetical protein BHV99_02775 [Clostridium sp. 26_21]